MVRYPKHLVQKPVIADNSTLKSASTVIDRDSIEAVASRVQIDPIAVPLQRPASRGLNVKVWIFVLLVLMCALAVRFWYSTAHSPAAPPSTESTKKEALSETSSSVDVHIADHKDHLKRLYRVMGGYSSKERSIVVTPAMKMNLDRISAEKLLELGGQYGKIKAKLVKAWPESPKSDQVFRDVVFRSLMDQLTDLELNKVLVSDELMPDFEGGIRSIKTRLAKMLNDQYGDKANAVIKAVFLTAQFDALDCLLSKRYGPLGALHGREGEYAAFRFEANRVYRKMADLRSSKLQ